MKKLSLLLASLVTLFLVACSNQKQADGKLNIVTTFYPVYEFTKQVAGDTANVELLIGAGTEPHEYEPSPKAVAKIQDADAFVYENENMETWVPKLLESLDAKKVKPLKLLEICYSFQEVKKRRTVTMVKKVIITSMTLMYGCLLRVQSNL